MTQRQAEKPTTESDASTPAIEISCAEWPLVNVTWRGDVTVEILTQAAVRCVELSIEAQKQGVGAMWLVNMNKYHALAITPAKRKAAAEVVNRYVPQIAPGTIGEARITQSTIVRGIMIAVSWLSEKPPWPIDVFATEEEARAWLFARRDAARG